MTYHYQLGVIKPFIKAHSRIFTAAIAVIFAFMWYFALFNSASAATAATDFESFATGDVNGQGGWEKTGPSFDVEVVDGVSVAGFGDQSLRISNAVTSGSFGDQTFSAPIAGEAGETAAEGGLESVGPRTDYFEASWDFSSTTGALQEGLSVVASPDRGDGARMSWIQMADNSTDGLSVNFYGYDTTNGGTCSDLVNFEFANLVSGLDRSVPHNIKVTMQFVDGVNNDVVEVYVDGALVHTGTSWEDYFRNCEGAETRTVDSVLFRVSGTAAPAAAGNGFLIDNYMASNEAADTEAPAKVEGMTIKVGSDDLGCYPSINTRNITVDWDDSTADDLDFYRYQADADGVAPYDFTTTVNQSQRSGTIRDLDGTYNYRVAAVDESGNQGEWSEWCGVTLDREAPDVPTLVFPENNSVVNASSPIANSWNAVAGAEFYTYTSYNVDGDGDCAGFRWTGNYTDPMTNSRAIADGLSFCWEVTATDAAGNESAPSELWKVTIDNTAPVVTIEAPADGDELGGDVDVYGTVADANLSHYNASLYPGDTDLSDGLTHTGDRLESNTVNTDEFTNQMVLGFDSADYEDGEYQIRLAARDLADNRDITDPYTGGTTSVHVITVEFDNYVSDKKECKNGGWEDGLFDGTEFRNQGQCIAHFESDDNSRHHRAHDFWKKHDQFRRFMQRVWFSYHWR